MAWLKGRHLPAVSQDTVSLNVRGPAQVTKEALFQRPQKGVRLVYDPTLNRRLGRSLLANCSPTATVPVEVEKLDAVAATFAEFPVSDEASLSARLSAVFFVPLTIAMNTAMPKRLGRWVECPRSSSGAFHWRYIETETGQTLGLIEIKPRSVLTDDLDFAAKRGEANITQLQKLASQGDGIVMGLSPEVNDKGEPCGDIKVVDEQGEPRDGLQHWSRTIPQIFESMERYKSRRIVVSTYDTWTAFEVDEKRSWIVRVGDPVYREGATGDLAAGQLTPLQLAAALTTYSIEEPPSRSFKAIPQQLHQSRIAPPSPIKDGESRDLKVEGASATWGVDAGMYGAKDMGVFPLTVTVPPDRSVETTANSFFTFSTPVPSRTPISEALSARHLRPCPTTRTTPNSPTPTPTPLSTSASNSNTGRLWDAYRAWINAPGVRAQRVVAKVLKPMIFGGVHGRDWSSYRSSGAAIAACNNEAALLEGPLRELQGSVVPRRYAAFVGYIRASRGYHELGRIHFEVHEDVGVAAGDEDGVYGLPLDERLAIESLYLQLHAARVLHNDVEERHIMRRPDGRFALIDFEGAQLVEEGESGDAKLRSELAEVRYLLGLDEDEGPE
ncbi:hypothetical protein IAT38_001057 [Cryptococcus sp. DSM 104549]